MDISDDDDYNGICPGCRVATDEYGNLCQQCGNKYIECFGCDRLRDKDTSIMEVNGCTYCFECYCQKEKLSMCYICQEIIEQGVIKNYIPYCFNCYK